MSDQPWHGSLIANKGLGLYAGSIGSVTAEGLGKLIAQAVADEAIARTAAEISEAIKAEDGPLFFHGVIPR